MTRSNEYLQSVEFQIPEDYDGLIADLWELGTTGLVENVDMLLAFFPAQVDLSLLLAKYPSRRVEVGALKELTNLKEAEPVLVADRFFILSTQSSFATPPGYLRIEVDAHNAFGSGSHESTQLVLAALNQHMKPGLIVLDVGSGSGVLAAAADLLGAAQIFACDTHSESVLLTRRHAPRSQVFAGSLDAVRSGSVDLVVANISARVIDQLTEHLVRVVKPEGLIILSGFISSNCPVVIAPEIETNLGEWRCWICRPSSLAGTSGKLSPPASIQPFEAEWW